MHNHYMNVRLNLIEKIALGDFFRMHIRHVDERRKP